MTRGNRRQVFMVLPMPVRRFLHHGVKDEIVEEVQSQSLLWQTDSTNQFGKAPLWRVSKRASVVRYSASMYERSS